MDWHVKQTGLLSLALDWHVLRHDFEYARDMKVCKQVARHLELSAENERKISAEIAR